jgi:Aspartyl protease
VFNRRSEKEFSTGRIHRRRGWLILALLGFVTFVRAASPQPPTFADLLDRAAKGDLMSLRRADLARYSEPERLLLQARIQQAQFKTTEADKLLDRYEQLGDREPARQREFFALKQDIAMLEANYAAARRHGEAWEAVPGSRDHPEFTDYHQTTVFAQRLKDVKPVEVRGSIKHQSLATTRDKIGLTRVVVSIEGQDQEAVVDTGASFSVVTASAATRLGLKPFDGGATLGSTTHDSIETRLTVANSVKIAGTEFSSVVLLILADEQLEFPVAGGYKIDAIVGFPELVRLRRLRLMDRSLSVEPPSQADPALGNLMLVGNKPFIATDLRGLCVPLYLDTGANLSSLSSLFMRDHPEVSGSLSKSQGKVGGAGGMRDVTVLSWRDVPVTVGRHRRVLPSLSISQQDPVANLKQYGTLGRDVLEQGYTLDFVAMTLELHGQQVSETNACSSAAGH